MRWMILAGMALGWTMSQGVVSAQETASKAAVEGQAAPAQSPEVEAILQKIQQVAKDLRSYQCGIDYVLRQPLMESKTRRTGMMYYVRGPGGSRLRVNFATLQQDDAKQQAYVQQFVFDGVWLINVDYQVKSWEKRQMAEPNKPTDAFELAARELPIVGFTGTDDLRREFDMQILPPPPGQPVDAKSVTLSLKAKPGSRYGQDYKTMAFTVDKTLWLPVKVEAESTEGDFYNISFTQVKINATIEDSVFELKVPKDYGEPEIVPLDAAKGARSIHVP